MNAEALSPEHRLGFIGKDTVGTTAISDDLAVFRQLGEPLRQPLHRHIESARNMAEEKLVFRPHIENGDRSVLDPGEQLLPGNGVERVRRMKVVLDDVPDFGIIALADRGDRTSFTSVGEGAVPFDDALAAARDVEWLVAEQDEGFVPDELSAAARSAAAVLELRERLARRG